VSAMCVTAHLALGCVAKLDASKGDRNAGKARPSTSGPVHRPAGNFSAISAMRALRDELRERLDQNEDYRAWKALDQALRELEPPSLPQAVEFALSTMRAQSGYAEVEASPRDDGSLNFGQRERA
jgi:hypothetical protein